MSSLLQQVGNVLCLQSGHVRIIAPVVGIALIIQGASDALLSQSRQSGPLLQLVS